MSALVPSRIQRYEAGDSPKTYVPGSFLLTHGTGFVGAAIRFGQSLRFPRLKWDFYNHAVGVTGEDGSIVEMLARGAVVGNISKYQNQKFHLIVPQISAEQMSRASDFWLWCSQEAVKYNWFAAGSDGVSCLTGSKFEFGTDGRMICSGMVAAGYCWAAVKGTEKWAADPSHVFPAELGAVFGLFGSTPG